MSSIEEAIEVEVPLRAVYDQWTQFEDFPQFMEGIESVTQLTDRRLHWVAEISGVRREWDAEIVEQRPDELISWRAVEGATNAGTVTFHPISPEMTRVGLRLDFEPEGIVEKIGDKLGFVDRRAEGDLERFKTFIESRQQATGAWRGNI